MQRLLYHALVMLSLTAALNRTSAGEHDAVLWTARSADGTAMWFQVHSNGSAWLQLRSLGERDFDLAVFARLEVAFQLDPSVYRKMLGDFEKAGVHAGDYASGDFHRFGISPIPIARTHLVSDEEARVFLNGAETALTAEIGDYHEQWGNLLQALRRAGLACVLQAQAGASLTIVHDGMNASGDTEASGQTCLLTPQVRRILESVAASGVQQLVFEVMIRSVPAPVELTVSGDAGLLFDDRPLMAIGLEEAASKQPGLRTFKGEWKQMDLQIRPSRSQNLESVLVHVVPGTRLHLARGLWTDDIEIVLKSRKQARRVELKSTKGDDPLHNPSEHFLTQAQRQAFADEAAKKTPVVDSRIVLRGGRISKCSGVEDCEKLSTAELRGLASAAFGQCMHLRSLRAQDPAQPSSFEVHVRVGQRTCSLSLVRQCLKEAPTKGLEYLFRRLSQNFHGGDGGATAHARCPARHSRPCY